MGTHRATDNLLAYVFGALLPDMKLPPSVSEDDNIFNTLSVRPERHRQLQWIRNIDGAEFRTFCCAWATKNIPSFRLGIQDEDLTTGKQLTVPSTASFYIPTPRLGRPSDIDRVSVWLDQLPFETAGRLLHIIYANTDDWKFALQEEDEIDNRIFRQYLWTTDEFPRSSISGQSIVLVVQPPWILSTKDLHEFASCRTFPVCPYPAEIASGLESNHRLWGKLWDICDRSKCPFFVVSTYVGWVFGAFSRGWTTAFVSQVYPFDSTSPTIVLALTYWLSCAMGCPDGWSVPILEEELVEHSRREISPTPPPSNYFRFVRSQANVNSDSGREDTVSINLDSRGRPFAALGVTRVWSQTSAHEYQGSESTDESQNIDWSGTVSCPVSRELEGCRSPVVTHDGYWAWHPLRLIV